MNTEVFPIRISVLSDPFDPVRSGHLDACRAALSAGRADMVLLALSGDPDSCAAPAEERWRMLVTACAGSRLLLPVRLPAIFSVSVIISDYGQFRNIPILAILGLICPFCNINRWKWAPAFQRAFIVFLVPVLHFIHFANPFPGSGSVFWVSFRFTPRRGEGRAFSPSTLRE